MELVSYLAVKKSEAATYVSCNQALKCSAPVNWYKKYVYFVHCQKQWVCLKPYQVRNSVSRIWPLNTLKILVSEICNIHFQGTGGSHIRKQPPLLQVKMKHKQLVHFNTCRFV